jgi:SNF2-related domain
MGSGKTCSAVGVAEAFIKSRIESDLQGSLYPETIIKKIMVLTKGKGLQGNFINEIANVCTSGQYLNYGDRSLNFDKKIIKNVKVNYTFETFEVFAKRLAAMKAPEKIKVYENTLFLVDEAHNLRVSDAEESMIYNEIYGLFEILKSRKVLLLTGTPMKDRPEEIVTLLNLILKDKLVDEDLQNPATFKRKITGYVSYLRAMMSDVDRTEVGRTMGTLEHFRVHAVEMEDFQSKVYKVSKRKDDEERSIFNQSRQSASMVFPDGSYGKTGFENNVAATSTGYRFSKASARDALHANLRRYSVKYADLLDRLNDDHDAGRLSFVFSEFVKGSGLVVLSILLEMAGYARATDVSQLSNPRKRYVIFTNETSTNSQTKKLIAFFNNSKNMNGRYISHHTRVQSRHGGVHLQKHTVRVRAHAALELLGNESDIGEGVPIRVAQRPHSKRCRAQR